MNRNYEDPLDYAAIPQGDEEARGDRLLEALEGISTVPSPAGEQAEKMLADIEYRETFPGPYEHSPTQPIRSIRLLWQRRRMDLRTDHP